MKAKWFLLLGFFFCSGSFVSQNACGNLVSKLGYSDLSDIHIVGKSSLLENWKNLKNTHLSNPKPKRDKISSSPLIWERIRSQFHLQASASHPNYQKQLKRLARSQDYVNEMVNNASPYLYHILEEVEKRGMPSEIALLPMVESTFNPLATSSKGAAGLWQLMPATGRLYGLKQNAWYDGRRDIYASTDAALDHLQYLHKRFNGNWLLALAAYNSGEGKIDRAIKQNKAQRKSTDFWSLKLPQQTTQFVPKLLAISAIVKAPTRHGVSLPAVADKPVFTRVETGKPLAISQAAKLADVPEKQLQKLNPCLPKKTMDPNGPYELVVPIQCAHTLKQKVKKNTASKTANKAKVASKTKMASKAKGVSKTQEQAKTKAKNSPKTVRYQVKKGDNLGKIAKRHHTSVATIKRLNRLPKNNLIHPGKTLVIAG